MTETKLNAALPNLDVEIVHRRLPEHNAEAMTIHLRATPSFEATAGLLPPLLAAQMSAFPVAQPMVFWARCMETLWRPWLQLAGMPLRLRSEVEPPAQLPDRG